MSNENQVLEEWKEKILAGRGLKCSIIVWVEYLRIVKFGTGKLIIL